MCGISAEGKAPKSMFPLNYSVSSSSVTNSEPICWVKGRSHKIKLISVFLNSHKLPNKHMDS